jgi:uncharacterized protein YkwD
VLQRPAAFLALTAAAAAIAAPQALARPTVRITTAPAHRATDSTAVFRWRASADTRFTTCRLVGRRTTASTVSRPFVRGFRRCTSPKVWPNLAPGRYAFTVRAYDAKHRHSQSRYRWTILSPVSGSPGAGGSPPPPPGPALAPPTVVLTQTPPSSTSAPTATFAWTTTGTVSSTSCTVDSGAAASCSSPATYTLAVGSHTFRVTVANAAGSATVAYSWTITAGGGGGGGSGSGCATAPYKYLSPVHPELSADEQQFVDLVNQARQGLGLAILTVNSKLNLAADSHSYWQDKTYGYTGLSHSGCNGSGPGERLIDAGYSATAWGEITLVRNPPADAATAFAMFKGSAPHWGIITSPSYTEVGVGESAYHWTADFGHP